MAALRETGRGAVLLAGRGILAVGGSDRATFLQGLISNDIGKLSAEHAIHAALLTPQGRYLHDFFIVAEADRYLLDGERARLGDLARRLSRYRLRSAVTFADQSATFAVAVAWGDGAAEALGLGDAAEGTARPFAGGIALVDPRIAAAGLRLVLPAATAVDSLRRAGFALWDFAAYDRRRIGLGLPDGSRDLVIERSLPIEFGFDGFNGIDWDKGCYVGQEVTARSKYRGLARHRLVPMAIDGPLPPPGTPVLAAGGSPTAGSAGEPVGEVRSGAPGLALGLIRLDALAAGALAGPLEAGSARVRLLEPGEGPADGGPGTP